MSRGRVKRRKLYRRLTAKGRIVVVKEDSFEEKFSIGFNIIRLFIFLTLSSIAIIALTTIIIAFTPLREYIPGYSSTALKKSALELAIKSDSLEQVISANEQYIRSIKKVLKNEFEFAHVSKDSIVAPAEFSPKGLLLEATKSELELREYVEKEDRYNLFEKASYLDKVVLFAPVKGKIIKPFNVKEKQYAVRITLGADKAVKAVSKGTVLFADWTVGSDFVVIIKHSEGLVSVYKGCTSVNKSVGDFVRSGEVIGLGMLSEEAQKRPISFELWKDGSPVNPEDLIEFEE